VSVLKEGVKGCIKAGYPVIEASDLKCAKSREATVKNYPGGACNRTACIGAI
jgi:hypothetical protein